MLNIRPLFLVPLQIPARRISAMRKNRVHASHRLRRIENVLSLVPLLAHSVISDNGDLPERLVVLRNSVAEHSVVARIRNYEDAEYRRRHCNHKFLQKT